MIVPRDRQAFLRIELMISHQSGLALTLRVWVHISCWGALISLYRRSTRESWCSGGSRRPACRGKPRSCSMCTAKCSSCQLGCSDSRNFPCISGSCYRSILSEIAGQNWPFEIGLSLLDFKQLLVNSGALGILLLLFFYWALGYSLITLLPL